MNGDSGLLCEIFQRLAKTDAFSLHDKIKNGSGRLTAKTMIALRICIDIECRCTAIGVKWAKTDKTATRPAQFDALADKFDNINAFLDVFKNVLLIHLMHPTCGGYIHR